MLRTIPAKFKMVVLIATALFLLSLASHHIYKRLPFFPRMPASQKKRTAAQRKPGGTAKKGNNATEKLLITAALPYANAGIHIGHLVEYVQADIFVRFLRLTGKKPLFLCASDTHGTPIEVNAEKLGITPEALVRKFNHEHREDFAAFHISFDDFYTTHSPENKELSELFFRELQKNGFIHKKKINVIFCRMCRRVLPDRYVRGTCPHCGTLDQYGDVCESCGLALKGTDLLNPKCSICSSTPQQKEREHYFFTLHLFAEKLRAWLEDNRSLQPEIRNHIREWLDKGLEDWCISRDGPYFGFLIPGEKDKYFYVWLDAPIGYIATTKHFTARWQDYWKDENAAIIHFIGKDITYFHFLFWPAMLLAAGFTLPKDIVVHGFLTVNGEKMSKSRGTFFTARDFLKLYEPETLRFYYALHLSKRLADVDLNFEDFRSVVNNTLVANIANFCYRVLSFAEKNYGGKPAAVADEPLAAELTALMEQARRLYEAYDFKGALAAILAISDKGNAYFQEAAPWKGKDNAKSAGAAQAAVAFAANIVRNLSILLSPVLPKFAETIQRQLGEKGLQWGDLSFGKKVIVKGAQPTFTRIGQLPASAPFPLDLRVGRIISAEDHPNADKLYVLQVDLGKEKRQLVAGLRQHYEKAALKGRHVVVVANLQPAKLRGVESQGMLLAADDGSVVSVLEAPKSAPGDAVHAAGFASSAAPVAFADFTRLELRVRNGKVFWNSAHLHTEQEDITVAGVRDGAVVR